MLFSSGDKHCAKNVQKRSFSSPYYTVFILNTGKHGPEKTPSFDIFHTEIEIEICYQALSNGKEVLLKDTLKGIS